MQSLCSTYQRLSLTDLPLQQGASGVEASPDVAGGLVVGEEVCRLVGGELEVCLHHGSHPLLHSRVSHAHLESVVLRIDLLEYLVHIVELNVRVLEQEVCSKRNEHRGARLEPRRPHLQIVGKHSCTSSDVLLCDNRVRAKAVLPAEALPSSPGLRRVARRSVGVDPVPHVVPEHRVGLTERVALPDELEALVGAEGVLLHSRDASVDHCIEAGLGKQRGGQRGRSKGIDLPAHSRLVQHFRKEPRHRKVALGQLHDAAIRFRCSLVGLYPSEASKAHASVSYLCTNDILPLWRDLVPVELEKGLHVPVELPHQPRIRVRVLLLETLRHTVQDVTNLLCVVTVYCLLPSHVTVGVRNEVHFDRLVPVRREGLRTATQRDAEEHQASKQPP
mmetsp:Transcript_19538/g.75003  ORF Transcript_19538/g.75003 Transcript_19538/m.75003 type:complete len:390 (-) Transcript_19538:11-1180(-)